MTQAPGVHREAPCHAARRDALGDALAAHTPARAGACARIGQAVPRTRTTLAVRMTLATLPASGVGRAGGRRTDRRPAQRPDLASPRAAPRRWRRWTHHRGGQSGQSHVGKLRVRIDRSIGRAVTGITMVAAGGSRETFGSHPRRGSRPSTRPASRDRADRVAHQPVAPIATTRRVNAEPDRIMRSSQG